MDLEDRFALAGRVVGERYAVETVVARGGFGLVYRAAHVELATPVALKVLLVPDHLRGAESALVERFRQEARTLALVRHPAVVRVLDVGRLDEGGEPCVWMALEWIDGETLDAHLRARGALSPREALDLLAPVFEATAGAHARGIAHRDLKPTNVLVAREAQGFAARVLDFGIAKEMSPDEVAGSGHTETRSDESAFSLPYAAPEQVGRARTGPWTDVHALALLLVEALTGHAPYEGTDSFALYVSALAPARPSPRRAGVEVGPWEAEIARALSLRPAERHASAREWLDALAATCPEAQRAWERARAGTPSPRRHPSLIVTASALATCALGLTLHHLAAPPAHPPRVAAPTLAAAAPARFPPPALLDAPAVLAAPVAALAPAPRTEAAPPRAPGLERRPGGRRRAVVVAPSAADPDEIVME